MTAPLRPRRLARLGLRLLPFSDAASEGLPLGQLLRLSLFQVAVGMATVLLLGTLNRVMIVELSVPAMVVATMIALPVLSAPLRAQLGFRSDSHRSAIGWKRIPFLWFGSLWQMGGLAVMPAAILVLAGHRVHDLPFAGEVLAAAAFVMAGIGLHMTQTAGLALACDRAGAAARPRVVALLHVMFLAGMAASSLIFGWLLRDFSELRLVQVVQGAAVATMVLNLVALWRQERVRPMAKAEREAPRPPFRAAWADYLAGGRAGRLLAVVFLGGLAFNMQDVLLEPYGGEVLGLSVAATTLLTALWAVGALAGFALAARALGAGRDPFRIAGRGLLVGLAAFPAVIAAAPLQSAPLFFAGAALIGLGGGLFAVATLTAAMAMAAGGRAGSGLALGAWGAAQATAAGLAILAGGMIRDLANHWAAAGGLGSALAGPATGYAVVYHIEIGLVFVSLAALGRLVGASPAPLSGPPPETPARFGLAELPS